MKKILISGLLSCSLLFSGLIGEQKAEASTVGQTATNIALSYVGVPYVYGGSTPSGFDCSGLVNFTYKQAGLSLPRTAADLYNQGQAVSKSNLKTGDLVFFATSGTSRVSHVGIYLNNNQFVHSATSSGVRVDSLSTNYWSRTYVGSKRVDTTSDGWVLSNGKWSYYTNGTAKTGWLYTGGSWYFLDAKGVMMTGWVYVNNEWYYLLDSGAMKTGWVFYKNDWYYMDASGAMSTNAWVLSSGKYYYMTADGTMAVNTTIDGYVVDSNGVWIK